MGSKGNLGQSFPLPLTTPQTQQNLKSPLFRSRLWIASFALLLVVVHLVYTSWTPRTNPLIHRAHAQFTTLPDLYEASVAELQSGMGAGAFTSVDLVKAYFKRIEEVNLNGPALRAVIETNPSALSEAQLLDEERAFFGSRGSLHGIPVLIKDNIGTIYSEGESLLPQLV
jgi:amidase